MLDNEKLLFDELYEKTKDCGRVQFVKLLMTKERENQELKKQLEERTKMYLNAYKYAQGMENEVITLNTQQKEFIKYLKDEIKQIKPKILDDDKLNLRLDDIKYTQYLTYKEILQKYKEIIGDDK